jgi:hypothetical protein
MTRSRSSVSDAAPRRSRAAALALVVALAAAIQLAALHPYLFHGGLFTDDWSLAATAHFGGAGALLDELSISNTERPLGVLYQALTAAAIGTDPELHALWGWLTHLACVLGVFYLVRALDMALPAAAALGLAVMLFPFSDSIWLWYAASHASLAIALAAVGGLLALRGLRGPHPWRWHAAATAAFAASVQTYPVITVSIVLTFAIYWPRAEPRHALALWAKDIGTAVVATALPVAIAGHRGVNSPPLVSLDEALRHAELIADQGLSLLARSLVPFGMPERVVVIAVSLAIVACAVVQAGAAEAAAREYARRWLGWGLAGAAVVVTGYAIYVPALTEFYLPLAPGSDNRVNALPGIGFCLIALSLAMLLAGFVLFPARRWRWTAAFGALLLAPVLVGYLDLVQHDMDDWNRAADLQRAQLARMQEIGEPPPETTEYVYGGVGLAAPGVTVFRVAWDLHNATRLLWDEYELRAFPVFEGTRIHCRVSYLVPAGDGVGPEQGGIYPNVLFTDLRSGERVRVRDRVACRRAVSRFEPGPP